MPMNFLRVTEYDRASRALEIPNISRARRGSYH